MNDCVKALLSKGISLDEAIETCEAVNKAFSEAEVFAGTTAVINLSDTAERYILAPVLIPNHLDTNGTLFPPTTVRRAAHNFMIRHQANKFMHMLDLNSDDLSIVESFVAPVDMVLEGSFVKKGTWMMGIIVHNDKLWQHIKDGNLRGFSIGAVVNDDGITFVAE